MTALPVSGVRRSALHVEPSHGFATGLVSALRKVAARVNAVEQPRRTNARARAAATANPILREHNSVCATL